MVLVWYGLTKAQLVSLEIFVIQLLVVLLKINSSDFTSELYLKIHNLTIYYFIVFVRFCLSPYKISSPQSHNLLVCFNFLITNFHNLPFV